MRRGCITARRENCDAAGLWDWLSLFLPGCSMWPRNGRSCGRMTRAPIGGSQPPVEANAESPHFIYSITVISSSAIHPRRRAARFSTLQNLSGASGKRSHKGSSCAPDMHPTNLYSQLVGIGRGRELASPGLAGYCLPSIPRAGATFKAAHDGDAQAAVRLWAQTPIMALRKMRKVAKGRHVVFPAPATS